MLNSIKGTFRKKGSSKSTKSMIPPTPQSSSQVTYDDQIPSPQTDDFDTDFGRSEEPRTSYSHGTPFRQSGILDLNPVEQEVIYEEPEEFEYDPTLPDQAGQFTSENFDVGTDGIEFEEQTSINKYEGESDSETSSEDVDLSEEEEEEEEEEKQAIPEEMYNTIHNAYPYTSTEAGLLEFGPVNRWKYNRNIRKRVKGANSSWLDKYSTGLQEEGGTRGSSGKHTRFGEPLILYRGVDKERDEEDEE
ncbi:hypothetical protein M231_04295 [Tremella mesenterica]|uniref:Uncharacterized protein n=1 Tax=Tremella mesenterica TaxID=5217 RepID=A0A4Q1BKZ2_TREME|nr:hypothetical protein M231_04295 [Tremella mesenterica]